MQRWILLAALLGALLCPHGVNAGVCSGSNFLDHMRPVFELGIGRIPKVGDVFSMLLTYLWTDDSADILACAIEHTRRIVNEVIFVVYREELKQKDSRSVQALDGEVVRTQRNVLGGIKEVLQHYKTRNTDDDKHDLEEDMRDLFHNHLLANRQMFLRARPAAVVVTLPLFLAAFAWPSVVALGDR